MIEDKIEKYLNEESSGGLDKMQYLVNDVSKFYESIGEIIYKYQELYKLSNTFENKHKHLISEIQDFTEGELIDDGNEGMYEDDSEVGKAIGVIFDLNNFVISHLDTNLEKTLKLFNYIKVNDKFKELRKILGELR